MRRLRGSWLAVGTFALVAAIALPFAPSIGIVVDRSSRDGRRHLVVHNIGTGPRLEDMLFDYPITGHYRYYGD